MNSEIKEILNNLRYTAKEHTIQVLENGGMIEHCPQQISTEMRLNSYSARTLLDYITNLQESEAYYYGQYKDYKSRVEKAIEYIEHSKFIKEQVIMRSNYDMQDFQVRELLNILNGRSDE